VFYPVEERTISEYWRDVRQGARVQDWRWPIQTSATQPQARQYSPEGSHPKAPMRRKVNRACEREGALGYCAPCQGHAIACGTRLALALWGDSDGMLFYGIGH